MSRQQVTYDSASREPRLLAEARHLWEFRHLVAELVSREVKVRYKRSALGVAWTMVNPLINMVALTVVFSLILRQGIENYPVYFLAGVLFWTFFAQSTGHVASLTVDATETARRIWVPHSVLVVAAIGVGIVNLLFALVPFIVIVLVTGHPIHLNWLLLPVSLLIGILFCLGIGLIVFTLACRFVDVRETYMVLLNPWFFVTPIVYTPSIVPPEYRWIVRLNPMTYLIEVFWAPLYDGWLPGYKTLSFSIVAAVAAFVIGWIFYSLKIDEYVAAGS